MPAIASIPRLSAASVRAARGPLTFDVRDFGAVADNVTDNYPVFVRTYKGLKDALGLNVQQRHGSIYWPGASKYYASSRPMILDDPYIGMVGEIEPGQSQITSTGFGPVVMLAVNTLAVVQGSPVKLDTSYRPTRSGVLDGTWGGHGFRGKGDVSVVFSSSPFNGGQVSTDGSQSLCNWSEHRYLTFEVALTRGDGTGHVAPSGSVEHIIGYGGYDSTYIFSLNKGGGAGQFDFFLSDSAGNSGSIGVYTSNPIGLLQMTVQIDLVAKTVMAWEGMTKLAGGNVQLNGDIWGIAGTGYWRRSEYEPFVLFAGNGTYDGRPPLAAIGRVLSDYTLYGMSFDSQKRYTTATTLTRLDAGVVNDGYRYGPFGTSTTFALLYGIDPANDPTDPAYITADPASSRLVSAFTRTSFRVFYGVAWNVGQFSSTGVGAGNSLRNLTLTGSDPKTNPVVQWGPLLDFEVRNCHLQNGTDGLAQIPSVATYQVRVQDCVFDIPGYGIFGAWSAINANDCTWNNTGRAIAFAWASNLSIRDADVRDFTPQCRSIVATRGGLYGGRTTIIGLTGDDEGSGCLDAAFDIRESPGNPSQLTIQNCDVESAANGVPALWLRAAKDPFTRPAHVTVQALYAPSATHSARVDSANWKGTIEVFAAAAGVLYTPTDDSSSGVADLVD